MIIQAYQNETIVKRTIKSTRHIRLADNEIQMWSANGQLMFRKGTSTRHFQQTIESLRSLLEECEEADLPPKAAKNPS